MNKNLLLLIFLTVFSNISFAQSYGDIAKKIGIERSIYCMYAGANLELQNGYGDKQAAAVGKAVKIAYTNLVNAFPPNQVEAVSNIVGKKMSSMSNEERMMAPLKCAQDATVTPLVKQAMASIR